MSDEKASKLRLWIGQGIQVRTAGSDLAEALHSVSELGLWPDQVDAVSEAQALMCWRIVERLRRERFPEDLRM